MRRAWSLVLVGLVALVAPLSAQDEEPVRVDLRQRFEERFGQQVRQQLGLTDAEAIKLRDVSQNWASKRRALEAEERGLKQALQGQLRPGVAANQDSVARLTQRLVDLKVTYAQTYRDELKDWAFLTPVQRAQLVVMRERLLQAIREARLERLEQNLGRPRRP